MYGGQFRRDVEPGDLVEIKHEHKGHWITTIGIFLGTFVSYEDSSNGNYTNTLKLACETGVIDIKWITVASGNIINEFKDAL